MPALSLIGHHNVTSLHIPKCGGSSLANWLRTVNGEYSSKNNLDVSANEYVIHKNHPTLSSIKEIYPDNYSFTVVRNPWDRAVSFYFYLMNTIPSEKRQRLFELNNFTEATTFEEFVKSNYKNFNLGDSAANPQAHWIDAPIDLIVKLEDLDSGMQPIKDMFETTLALPKVNASSRNIDYRQYYNTETKNIIANRYQQDIEMFGYTF